MRLLLFFGVMAGICAFASAQDKSDAKAAHALYEKAIKKKKIHERLAALRAASARYPQAAELHYGLGREFYQLAQLDSATARFELVAALNADLAQRTNLRVILASAYATLASQRSGRGRLIPAVEAALACLRHDAKSVSCLTTAMIAYQQLGEYEQALSFGLRLVALQPSARNYNNLGATYESRGEWLAAKKYYTEALALAPRLSEAQNNLNRINSRLEQQAATVARAKKPAEAPNKIAENQPIQAVPQEVKPPESKSSEKDAVEAETAKTEAPVQPESKPQAPAFEPAVPQEVKPPESKSSEKDAVKAETAKTEAPVQPESKPQAPAFEPEQKKASHEESGQSVQSAPATRPVEPALEPLSRGEAGDSARVTAPSAPALPVVSSAPQHARSPATFLWICGVLGAALVVVILCWKFFQHRALARRFAKDIVTSEPEVAANATVKTAQAAAPTDRPTEDFFDEMMAEALGSVNEPARNGQAAGKAQHATARERREDSKDVQLTATESGALPTTPAALVDTPPHVNGKVEVRKPAIEELPAPPDEILAVPSSPQVALPEGSDKPLREQPQEMTTMGFVAGVEEMMHEPVAGKPAETAAAAPLAGSLKPASAATEDAAFHLATRTMEISTLAAHRLGRYLIEKEIARAATGRIYKAWDPKLDRSVVLKTVQYGFAASPQEIATMKDRIYREARAIAKLQHPNIVIVYDVDDQPEFSYLVMEYLEGRDLKQVLESENRIDWRRAFYIVMQVCEAMEYAHRSGVFHRDVKPSNIMLLEADETKVTDFGIARISNYLSLTQTGKVLGTPSYMAPEQIEGQATDGRADLFSLGIVLYELIIGKRPFIADSLAALAYKIVHKPHVPPSLENVELPQQLDEVLQNSLAKKPEDRYQSAAAFREALRVVMAKSA